MLKRKSAYGSGPKNDSKLELDKNEHSLMNSQQNNTKSNWLFESKQSNDSEITEELWLSP